MPPAQAGACEVHAFATPAMLVVARARSDDVATQEVLRVSVCDFPHLAAVFFSNGRKKRPCRLVSRYRRRMPNRCLPLPAVARLLAATSSPQRPRSSPTNSPPPSSSATSPPTPSLIRPCSKDTSTRRGFSIRTRLRWMTSWLMRPMPTVPTTRTVHPAARPCCKRVTRSLDWPCLCV